jgi:hypothetical protein
VEGEMAGEIEVLGENLPHCYSAATDISPYPGSRTNTRVVLVTFKTRFVTMVTVK